MTLLKIDCAYAAAVSCKLGGVSNLEFFGKFAAPARAHPRVHRARIVDHFAHRRIETKHAIWNAKRFERIAHRTHAAHQVRTAAADHHVQGSRAMLAEMFAQ